MSEAVTEVEEEESGPKMGKKATGISADSVLSVVVTENPKREGSQAHARFGAYFTLGDDATVQTALDAGLTMGDIKYDLIHGSIEVSGASVEEYEVTPRGSRSEDDSSEESGLVLEEEDADDENEGF